MSPMPRIAVLPGDGIGPEVINVAVQIARAAGLQAHWEQHPVGWDEWRQHGEPLPASTLEACRQADAVLFGAITSKADDQAQQELDGSLRGKGLHYRSPILRLRQELGLFANIRPINGNGLDLTIFRENTEDLYGGHEARGVLPESLREEFPGLPVGPDTAVSLRVVTRAAMQRITEAAFTHAESHGKDRVTLVEKPNVLRATGGLARDVFYEVARDHPDIQADDENIDAACARLVRDGARYQVIVATNLFGDILSDLAAELSGNLAHAASANIGDNNALFEPVHGSAPDIAGQGIADPIGAVRAVALMADHLGQKQAAQRIHQAVQEVLTRSGPLLRATQDIQEALLQHVDAVLAKT